MKKPIQPILQFILDNFNLEIKKGFPKEAVKFAMSYFKDKPVIVAEIGVYEGMNAQSINRSLNVKKFYLIDCYKEYNYVGNIKGLDKAKKKAHQRNRKWKNTNIWIEKFSNKAQNHIKDNSLDFLYIDGNHNYDYVKEDLNLYWNKVKKGGIISGHDIQGIEVSNAVLDFVNENKLKVQFGERKDWWIIK